MSKYYHLKVKEVVRETADTVSIHFWHPWNEVVQYKPGQYFTILWPAAGDTKLRRSYSLSSSPYTDISPAITVKEIAGGAVSGHLASDVREGDILEIMQATGTFFLEPDADLERTIFLLGTGSGISPLISIAKSVLVVEPESRVVLVYGNRRKETIIFFETILRMQEKYKDRFQVIHSLTQPLPGWEGHTGRLTKDKLGDILQPYAELVRLPESRFFICGQEEFMDEAMLALETLGANKEAVSRESFYINRDIVESEPPAQPETNILQDRTILLRYEGEEHNLRVGAHQTVLEAALESDIDLPYSCQAGMCTACLGRALQGKVVLDEYDSLTEAELKEGFILTCVAHPVTDDVIIEVE
ncbi:MAG: oxidoreductase [Cytophagaceae bacterium SCN 52-12]|nr:MAG: oxidoreductase [Cytophagaceae bacterium SCN 52-12]